MIFSKYQQGTTTVEFAVVGFVLFLILFSFIEVGRLMFTLNTINELTRRAARVAVVCPVNHAEITTIANLNTPGDGDNNRILSRMSGANFEIDYLDEFGGETGTFTDIDFIRVSLTGYQHEMLIPGLNISIDVPPFVTTLPVESLGYIPETNTRECFGSA